MKVIRLTGWLLAVVMAANFFLASSHIALAQSARTAESTAAVRSISINKGTAEELEMVRGIGPALAERIIEYRQANGGFKSLDELKEVRGIGDLKFEKIKDQITL